MNSNLKIIIYCDEEIYQQIYNKYTYFDETSNMRFHFFDRNNPDIKHITTNRFINFSINNIGGYQNISHVIIQKSFYKNVDIINILRKFRIVNPDVKLLLLLDDDPEFYPVLLSIIAKEELCSIAFNIDDLVKWFENGAEPFDHSNLILNKIKNKLYKDFIEN